MTSTQIGPAMAWGSYHMKERALESNSADSIIAPFIGIDLAGNRFPLDTLTESAVVDISSISSTDHPYAELSFFTEDNANSTPAQLKNWHVLYDPAPDAAINPIKGQTLQEGETAFAGLDLNVGVAFENISDFDFGAFKVHYWLMDNTGTTIAEEWLNYQSLDAGEVVFDSVSFATNGLNGRHYIYMEVNPKGDAWHKEQFQFNNLAYIAFDIESDVKNPLLDVTFDGVHILNGDIVSPTPEIVMELKDENQFLLMDDTTSFDVFIVNPSGAEKRIPFLSNGVEIMYFEPATDKQNKARITYKPAAALSDGDYTLKVMGRDATGNESGETAYTIEFEVINRSTVTRVMNYPNPFSTSTKFVFTLTGAVIPDVFTIQIMTITGKVVREITKDELGNIHIGKNITDYAWDGRDEYGDRLANGVYLYRVIMKIDGTQIENRETAADSYFTKEFGKMYLFR